MPCCCGGAAVLQVPARPLPFLTIADKRRSPFELGYGYLGASYGIMASMLCQKKVGTQEVGLGAHGGASKCVRCMTDRKKQKPPPNFGVPPPVAERRCHLASVIAEAKCRKIAIKKVRGSTPWWRFLLALIRRTCKNKSHGEKLPPLCSIRSRPQRYPRHVWVVQNVVLAAAAGGPFGSGGLPGLWGGCAGHLGWV